MPMYSLMEYTENRSETLSKYFIDEQGEADNTPITDSESFKSKVKITVKTPECGSAKMLK